MGVKDGKVKGLNPLPDLLLSKIKTLIALRGTVNRLLCSSVHTSFVSAVW